MEEFFDCHFPNRFQFGSVPSEVFRYGHHLIHDTIHFLYLRAGKKKTFEIVTVNKIISIM